MIQSCPPVEKLGMSSSSWRRLACPIGTISLLLNENPKRANSRKKLRFLNGCLFSCCLRRGVIADAPPFHVFFEPFPAFPRFFQSFLFIFPTVSSISLVFPSLPFIFSSSLMFFHNFPPFSSILPLFFNDFPSFSLVFPTFFLPFSGDLGRIEPHRHQIA